jgi:hypothetical protein
LSAASFRARAPALALLAITAPTVSTLVDPLRSAVRSRVFRLAKSPQVAENRLDLYPERLGDLPSAPGPPEALRSLASPKLRDALAPPGNDLLSGL